MQIQIVGKNIELTSALKTQVEESFATCEKHGHNPSSAHVVLSVEHDTHIAEATIIEHGIEFIAKAESSDMYLAINQLTTKLMTQLQKHKDKLIGSHR